MEYLTEEDEAKYKEHFASYIENELTFEDVEDMYKETHKAIREDPSPAAKTAFTPDKSFKNAVSAFFCLVSLYSSTPSLSQPLRLRDFPVRLRRPVAGSAEL